MNFRLQDRKFDHVFYVLPNIKYWAVLGTDFLTLHRCYLDYDSHTLTVNSLIPHLMSLSVENIANVHSVDVLDCENYLRHK